MVAVGQSCAGSSGAWPTGSCGGGVQFPQGFGDVEAFPINPLSPHTTTTTTSNLNAFPPHPFTSICSIFLNTMATATSHNKKSSAIKRILSEARELSSDTSTLYTASPLDDNIFEWHFTLRGPANTEFASGLYHGRILLPAEYPMRPPDVMLLTPNGRWELNKKICLTFTGFHEEMWQPAWGIRTALLGLQTFMAEREEKAVGVGGLEWGTERRRTLARESREWRCESCAKTTKEMLPDPVEEEEQKDMTGQKGEVEGDAEEEETTTNSEQPSEAPITPPAPPRPPSPLIAVSQLHQQPPAPAPAPSPHTTSLTSTPPISHTSPTQQKLTLIDNCIKALSILVALLVVKRLI